MKRRFFLLILCVMAVAIVAVISFQEILFLNEQNRLIDARIEATATVLLSSDLSLEELNDVDEAAYLIEDLLGGESFNQFLILKDRTGREIYRTPGKSALPAQIPADERWQSIDLGKYIIRVLSLPVGQRVLQAGLIRDKAFMRWQTVTRGLIVFAVGALLATVALALLLSQLIWTPISRVSEQIEQLIDRTARPFDGSSRFDIPTSLRRLADQSDEFGILVQRLIDLHKAVDGQSRAVSSWTARAVHELKTPLTVMGARLTELSSASPGSEQARLIRSAWDEIHHLSDVVNRYLVWTRLQSPEAQRESLHAIRLGPAVETVAHRLASLFKEASMRSTEGHSAQASGPREFTWHIDPRCERERVFSNPSQFDELISNLVSNALAHGRGRVTLRCEPEVIWVSDEGPGPSSEVLSRLGEPFNRGVAGGTGLGLAHVKAICENNGWSLVYQPFGPSLSQPGFSIGVRFPDLTQDSHFSV